jgi:glycosyltransferase involved in cell wall biosynthesis
VAKSRPAVTVAIATYNWSSALRCAIRSVLLQTMRDFEVLVVGDGCTDDTAAVVASFNDRRLRFHNLARNHRNQWAANNFANENAAADWIAYLGHDDIWYPTHLESVLRTARDTGAGIVTSVMIMYGPEGTGIRALAGLFATGRFGPRDIAPPSAVAHATSIHRAGVKWRDHETLSLPVDLAFVREAAAHAAVASTGELTCFKFNAATRRDAYKIKSAAEQERMLRRIESGVDFRQQEYRDVLKAVLADKFLPVEAPPADVFAAGALARSYRQWKGVESRYDPSALRRIEARTHFDMTDQSMPFEWHELETNPRFGTFRWTGPSSRATIDLPVLFDRDLLLRIHVIRALGGIDRLALSIHAQPVAHRVERLYDGTFLLQARLDHAALAKADRDFGITLDGIETLRPIDLGPGEDRRWLGLAVAWCEMDPA